jgi:hypothetical protein
VDLLPARPTPSEEPIAYYPEAKEYPFGFEILDSSNPPRLLCTGMQPCRIVATYLHETPYESEPYGGKAFRFETADAREPITLTVRSGYADQILLVPDTTYQLIAQTVPGWPDTFGLVIKEGDQLVFWGLTDWELDRTILLGCLAPVRAEQVRVLGNHFREGDSCYGWFTNTEIAFSLDGASVVLHQGDTATLGDYDIHLAIARTIDHYYCPDAGLNNISFTVSRRDYGAPGSSEGATETATAGPSAWSKTIAFPDPNLERFIRLLVGKDTGPIVSSDLEKLDCFIRLYPGVGDPADVAGQGSLSDLGGLEHCANLRLAALSAIDATDLSPLAQLTKLKELHVDHSALTELSPLKNLVGLTHLRINNNQLSELSPLSSLANLEDLYARDNQISNISPLSSLTQLSKLNLDENDVTDLTPLSPLVGLTRLSLYQNRITNIAPLYSLVNLRELALESNQVVDLSPLSSLVNLTNLSLHDNQITDLAALSTLVNLTDLRLADNEIEDISGLTGLDKLSMLDLSGNRINDISPLVENTGLGKGDHVYLKGNPLHGDSVDADLQLLISRGVHVSW